MTAVEPAPPRPLDPDTVRAAVRAWLDEYWDPDLSLIDWRQRLVSSGWAAPSWLEQWGGRGLPTWADELTRAEFAAAGAVYIPIGAGTALAAPTILTHGPDSMRERFLKAALTGKETWCQLFSEPGAGSDLAGVTTRGELDGDTWVVSGQKVWNTSAHHADLGLLVARTDWDVPKHSGLTYFLLPMRQPGVEIRPLRQMNDHSSFNEVFLTVARIPRDWVVGAIGDGWRVALTTLAFERRFSSVSRPKYPQSDRRALVEARQEANDYFATYGWYPQRAGRVDLVAERARSTGSSSDPIVRQEIARLWSMYKASGWTAERARSAGGRPGPEGSIGKLSLSLVARQAAKVHALTPEPTAC
jgi:alkylation response protein AidB-like acyl-CoA dehydrogenase